MQLIGYLDSPFVRRVAVSMQFLGIEYEHRELSIFRNYDEFRALHPSVKVPTLQMDDGTCLIESSLIINHLEQHIAHRSLMPEGAGDHLRATERVGAALATMEKVAQVIYETGHRPPEKQHAPWVQRIEQQLAGTTALLERWVSEEAAGGSRWFFGEQLSQADISIAVAWRFMQHIDRITLGPADFPSLAAFSARAEALPEFKACPLSG